VRAAVLDHPALDVLHRVADEVGKRLAATTDWRLSGSRAGQYAVDVSVDDVAVGLLLDAGFAVLSEESGRSGDGDPVVVVDPLDGSTNASRGIPWFATSLCVVDDDGPVVALVVNQATGERLETVRGHGAWIGLQRLAASGRTEVGEAVIGISGLPAHGCSPGWWQFRALGAAALDLGCVAAARLDGWIDMSDDAHGVWDYLAGALLCAEAGACVTDAFGRDLVALDHAARRTPVAAATPELLDVLLGYRRPGD
jgi:myo-inositol-1(or 4)-monophosphatase